MRELCEVHINSIKKDFERDFWHRLTSKGDKEQARFSINHYSFIYNLLNKYLEINEKEYIKSSINKLNNMLIDEGEIPETIILLN